MEKYGNQYASAIFYHNETQRVQAESSRRQLEQSGIFELPVRTRITKASRFYLADNAHQDHYLYVPLWYKGYQKNATARQHKLWGDKKTFKKRDDDVLKENLTPLQYRVTQNGRTEMSWKNEYWNNKASGIYVDVVTGEPLFSSRDKYNAETGWPSFSKPLMSSSVVEHNDTIPGPWMEVKSRHGNSHLGHVFYNQPKSSTGLRYCINSASLRFIRKADLVKEGYGRYMTLFENVEAQ